MTQLRRHISVLLMLAIFSLMMHVGVYHAPEVHDDHVHEHAEKSNHPGSDSEICIAGLTHAQPSIENQAPIVHWVQIGIVSTQSESRGYTRSLADISGRAPPLGAHVA